MVVAELEPVLPAYAGMIRSPLLTPGFRDGVLPAYAGMIRT